MANVMRAASDLSGTDAIVWFDIGSLVDELYITYDVFFPTATVAASTASSGYLGAVSSFLWTFPEDPGGPETDGVLGNVVYDILPSFKWTIKVASTTTITSGDVSEDFWHTVSVHWITDHAFGPHGGAGVQIDGMDFGVIDAPGVANQVNGGVWGLFAPDNITAPIYFRNIKVGTTAYGSSDLFSEDFSGGNLAAFTGTFGDVSVIPDPTGGGGPGPVPPNGIVIAFPNNAYDIGQAWTRMDDPTWPGVWPDNSRVVVSWETHRGRQYELDKTQAGTATITMVDETGRLDPTNTNGPYYGNIKPLRQVKISAQNPVDGSYHDIFTGFAESWVYQIDPAEKLMTVTLNVVDGFEPLARTETIPDGISSATPGTTTYAGGVLPDSRIGAALDDAGWPALWRNIFSGNVNLQTVVYNPQTSILSVIQDAADAEFPAVANVFIDRWGRLAFRGRWARFYPDFYGPRNLNANPPPGSKQGYTWSVGDINAANTFPNCVPISSARGEQSSGGIEWNLDLKNIINVALATPNGILPQDIFGQRVFDSASINEYGVRAQTFPDLLEGGSVPGPIVGPPTNSPGGDGVGAPAASANKEAKIFGQYFIDNYSQPVEMIQALTFDARDPRDSLGPALWAFLTGVEIGDIIIVYSTNPGGGGFKATQFFVEGIHNSVTLGGGTFPQWTMTLDLSPRAWYRKFNGVTYFVPPVGVVPPFGRPSSDTGGTGGGVDGADFTVTISGTVLSGDTLTANIS